MILAVIGGFLIALFLGRRLDTRRNPPSGFELFLGVAFIAWVVLQAIR